MLWDEIEKIEELSANLGKLIVNTNPQCPAEWDAFDKMVAAHRQLRKIDTNSLRQIPLPITD